MTYCLRNENNRTIVDIELYVKKEDNHSFVELYSVVVIGTYSELLLNNLDRKDEIINDFDELSELRGWLWENYFMGEQNDPKEYDNAGKALMEILKKIAEKYNLSIVTD